MFYNGNDNCTNFEKTPICVLQNEGIEGHISRKLLFEKCGTLGQGWG